MRIYLTLSLRKAAGWWTASTGSVLLDRDHTLVCLLGGILPLLFGAAHEIIDPHAWDPWTYRGGLSALAFALPLAYGFSAWVRLHFQSIFHILLFAFTLWVVALCTANGFSPSYTSGLIFISVGTVSILGLSRTQPLSYLLYTLALTAAGLAISPDAGIEHVIFIGSIAGCGTSVYVMSTRQRRVQDALEKSERQSRAAADFFEKALGTLPLEVAIFDSEARYVYINPAAVRDENVRDWMIGKTSVDYAVHRGFDPEPFLRRYEWLLEVARTKMESRHEETVTGHTGETKHILRVASPVLDREGNVLQIFAYGVDLTERKYVEEQLFEAKERAEEMLRLKSAFLSNMSHEIRTPLTGILGFANVLAEEATGKTQEFATGIARGASRLHETLESVLDIARLESGRYLFETSPLDVVPEVNESVRLLALAAEKKGLYLKVVHSQEEAIAEAESPCMNRILYNLIGNAIKFTNHGGVTVSTDVTEDSVVIRVADTGIGIAEDFLPHLFEAFRQESTGFARTHEGVGLGLAITHRIVELLEGTIAVESAKGKGTVFTVLLPRGDFVSRAGYSQRMEAA